MKTALAIGLAGQFHWHEIVGNWFLGARIAVRSLVGRAVLRLVLVLGLVLVLVLPFKSSTGSGISSDDEVPRLPLLL